MSSTEKLPFGRVVNSEGEWCLSTAVVLTGTTAQTLLSRVRLPGGYLGTKGSLDIRLVATNNSSVNDKTLVTKMGPSIGAMAEVASHIHTTEVLEESMFRITNKDNTASQLVILSSSKTNESPVISVLTDPAIDTEQDFYLEVYGQLESGSDTMTLHSLTVVTRYRD